VVLGELNIDEAYDPRLKLVLGRLDDNDEFLRHLWTDFQGQLLLQLLGNGVLDEPAAELLLRVSDLGAVLVLEGELVSVVLAENSIALKHILLRNIHGHDLVLFADVCKQQS